MRSLGRLPNPPPPLGGLLSDSPVLCTRDILQSALVYCHHHHRTPPRRPRPPGAPVFGHAILGEAPLLVSLGSPSRILREMARPRLPPWPGIPQCYRTWDILTTAPPQTSRLFRFSEVTLRLSPPYAVPREFPSAFALGTFPGHAPPSGLLITLRATRRDRFPCG